MTGIRFSHNVLEYLLHDLDELGVELEHGA